MTITEVQYLFECYRGALGDSEWHDMCVAFSRPLPSTFWIHPTRHPPSWVAQSFRSDGHRIVPIPYIDGGYKSNQVTRWGRRFEFRAGLIHLQEAASMLPPLVLRPEPGELVLDMCAAPGGKSAQLALQMKNTGTLVVNDLSFGRLRALRATQERLGLRNMVLCAQKGETFLLDHPPVFDKVLVDAPCSCEGTLRKRGRWSFEQHNEQFKNQLIETQRALLLQALRLTRPGGRVVYSTCTLDPRENEGVIASVLEDWTHLRKRGSIHLNVSIEPLIIPQLNSSPGLKSWQGIHYGEDLTRTIRVYPHRNDTGGFFIASLRINYDPKWSRHKARQAWGNPVLIGTDSTEHLRSWTQKTYGMDLLQSPTISLSQNNTRLVSSLSTDLRLPPTRYQTAGLPTFYIRGAIPRLTSAAALEWGQWSTGQVVELTTRAQVDQYYQNNQQVLTRSQIYRSPMTHSESQMSSKSKANGVYIVRYQGIAIGLGYVSEMSGGTKTIYNLKSEYPQRVKLSSDRSAFEPPLHQA